MILIDKDKLLDDFYSTCNKDHTWDHAHSLIINAPNIEPERKTGKWIEEQHGIKVTLYKCSECGRTVMDDTGYDVTKDYPFCHCGADMNPLPESYKPKEKNDACD